LITDVWAELKTVFGIRLADIYPGIQVNGLNRHLQEMILRQVLQSVHDIEPMLEDVTTGLELYPQTIDSIVACLLSEQVDGMIWLETEVDKLVLPQLGLFVPDMSSLSIHYIMGMWTPVTLIGLFELLRWIHDLDNHVQIQMEQDTAPQMLLEQFNETWQAYLNDEGRL
jgi:hypothetical protein